MIEKVFFPSIIIIGKDQALTPKIPPLNVLLEHCGKIKI
jgi:hypothetical protein